MPKISISAGVAYGDENDDFENVFKNADDALYKVKRSKRGGCAFYEDLKKNNL